MKTTKRKFKHLTFTQRIQIETLLKTKMTVRQIAQQIGVCYKTVYNELKRGIYKKKITIYQPYDKAYKYVSAYSPDIAEEKYRKNLENKGPALKIDKDYRLVNFIEERIIKDKLTPTAVLGRIKKQNLKFDTEIKSVNTLYSYIYKGVFLNLSMQHLTFKGKQRKPKNKVKISRAPKGTSIELRPYDILSRSELGHWEMDCVCGPIGSPYVLLVLTERLSRKEIVFKMKGQNSENVVHCLNVLEKKYGTFFPKIFKTITVDNGSEFSAFKEMELSMYGRHKKRTTVYYCHPYSSCERGTNERINREIRRIYPKGTNFKFVSDYDVANLESWLNNYPRQVLNFSTPNEVYNSYINMQN